MRTDKGISKGISRVIGNGSDGRIPEGIITMSTAISKAARPRQRQ